MDYISPRGALSSDRLARGAEVPRTARESPSMPRARPAPPLCRSRPDRRRSQHATPTAGARNEPDGKLGDSTGATPQSIAGRGTNPMASWEGATPPADDPAPTRNELSCHFAAPGPLKHGAWVAGAKRSVPRMRRRLPGHATLCPGHPDLQNHRSRTSPRSNSRRNEPNGKLGSRNGAGRRSEPGAERTQWQAGGARRGLVDANRWRRTNPMAIWAKPPRGEFSAAGWPRGRIFGIMKGPRTCRPNLPPLGPAGQTPP